MPQPNDIFWPELQPSMMPGHFNDYKQLLLAEGDSWFAWAYMGFDISPSILNALAFDRSTATRNPFDAKYSKVEDADWETCSLVLDAQAVKEQLSRGW